VFTFDGVELFDPQLCDRDTLSRADSTRRYKVIGDDEGLANCSCWYNSEGKATISASPGIAKHAVPALNDSLQVLTKYDMSSSNRRT
jgi:hypothetical protein